MKLWFVETHSFTKRIQRLGLEEDLLALQEELLATQRPEIPTRAREACGRSGWR